MPPDCLRSPCRHAPPRAPPMVRVPCKRTRQARKQESRRARQARKQERKSTRAGQDGKGAKEQEGKGASEYERKSMWE